MSGTDQLRQAFEAAYRLPPGFPGYGARITLHRDGVTREGTAEVLAPRTVTVLLPEDPEGVSWATGELASLAGHHWPRRWEESDGRFGQRLGGENAAGQEIRLEGDAMDSSYRVAHGHITEVSRMAGGFRFQIHIQARQDSGDGRSLATAFTVHYWDAGTGRLQRSDAYTDRYVRVDGCWLPAMRSVLSADDLGASLTVLTLEDHALRTGPVAADQGEIQRRN